MCEMHRIWSGEANTDGNFLHVRIDTNVTGWEIMLPHISSSFA